MASRSRTRPVEIWKDRDVARCWHWRCNCCGLLHGGHRSSQPRALAAGLGHITGFPTAPEAGTVVRR